MSEKIFQDQEFEQLTAQSAPWPRRGYEYENCMFLNCNFMNADFSDIKFYDCQFENCDLSLAKVEQTILQQVFFKGSKLSGVLFDSCHPFALEVQFWDSRLDHSSFYGLKINKASFINCSLRGVDFSSVHLKEARFTGSDLLDAKFDQSFLEKADFSGASHYQIHPEHNQIKGAVFSQDGLGGLLSSYQIKIVP